MGSVYTLRRHGTPVLSGESAALGSAYDPEGRTPAEYVLRIERAPAPPDPGATVLARIPLAPDRPVPGQDLVVTLAQAR
jgi:hypothetical protein